METRIHDWRESREESFRLSIEDYDDDEYDVLDETLCSYSVLRRKLYETVIVDSLRVVMIIIFE